MTGKSGAARIALSHRLPGDPGRPVGRARAAGAVREEAGPVPAQEDRREGRRPGRPRRPARTRAATPAVISEATDRIMAAITALVEEHPRRAGARRAVRPAASGRQRDRQPEQEAAGGTNEQGRGVRRRLVGHGVLDGARRRRQRRDHVGPPRGGRARRSTSSARTPTTCPASSCRPRCRRRTTTRRRCTTPTSWCSPCRRRRCARTSPVFAPYIAGDAVMVSLMKGVELGTLKRMSEVIAEVTGAGPDRIAVISGPNLAKEIARREPAASVVACADEDVAQDAAGALPLAGVPSLHQRRRARAASSAAPTRTSSASRSAWPSGSASATTPPRR